MSAYEIYAPEDDEAAFAAVYEAHAAKLLRYCQYRLRDRYEAEDVVQEAFARAWRTLPAGNGGRNFYPWLRVVAGNLCTDILRKRSRCEPVAAIDLGSVDGGMDRMAEESDQVLVRQALGRLNDRHRSALMMRESEGLTYDQIAQRTGVTPGTVESLLWRARQALKREFTVLAGREGCLAVVPLLLLVAARTRAGGRRAWFRLTRRFPVLDPSSDTPLAHIAVAAVAALTVATGVAATLEIGGQRAGSPSLVLQVRPAVTSVIPAPTTRRPAPPGTPGGPGVPPSSGSPLGDPAASRTYGEASTSAPGPVAGPAPLRVVSPVVMGHAAATYASNSPVTVKAAGLVVGVSPATATTYLSTLGGRATTPVASAAASVLQEKKP